MIGNLEMLSGRGKKEYATEAQAVAGGNGGNGLLASAELYDPDSGSWAPTGNLVTPRGVHSAILLLDGTVIVAGGVAYVCGATSLTLASVAELYDPR